MKAAVRRSDQRRAKEKAKQVVTYWWDDGGSEQMQQWAIKNANHLRKCSCWMCKKRRYSRKGHDESLCG